MSIRKSILRTARHHRYLDRNLRVQHGSGPTSAQRWATLMKYQSPSAIELEYQGYHNCMCRACRMARGHWARQTAKAIIREMESWRDKNGMEYVALPNIDFNAPGNERITAIYSDQYLAALTAAVERSDGRPIIFFDDMPPLNHQTSRET